MRVDLKTIRLLIGLCLVATPVRALAGAWTLRDGDGVLILAVTPSTAPEAFIGSKSLSPTYDKIEGEALLEYGLTDKLTLILSPTVDDVHIGAPTDASRLGLGYTDIGGRYNFINVNNWVFSAQATVRVPGTSDYLNPAAVGYTSVEADLRGLVGYSFNIGPMPAFVDGQLAERYSDTGPPSEVHGDFTLGVRVLPRWLVLAQSFSVISEGNHLPVFTSYNYSKAQLSLVYDLSKQWSIQAGAFTTYEERNALEERGFVTALWFRF